MPKQQSAMFLGRTMDPDMCWDPLHLSYAFSVVTDITVFSFKL